MEEHGPCPESGLWPVTYFHATLRTPFPEWSSIRSGSLLLDPISPRQSQGLRIADAGRRPRPGLSLYAAGRLLATRVIRLSWDMVLLLRVASTRRCALLRRSGGDTPSRRDGGAAVSQELASTDVADNVARIRERIARAAERTGRRPEAIRLIAVSKQVDPDRIRQAVAAGVADIGENYVQEAARKKPDVPAPARWHLIGHLQRNKAGQAVALFDMVQTVDSLSLAQAIGRRAQLAGRRVEVLIQVNTSGEATKFGVPPEQAGPLAEQAAQVTGIQVAGLMTIGLWEPDPQAARPEFRLLASLARQVEAASGMEMRWLSMGMSHDFEVAIEEGANLVRIGTGVFGPRRVETREAKGER